LIIFWDKDHKHGDGRTPQVDGTGKTVLAIGGGNICAQLEETNVVGLEQGIGLNGDVLEPVRVVVEGV
jgi:hypothetical protein